MRIYENIKKTFFTKSHFTTYVALLKLNFSQDYIKLNIQSSFSYKRNYQIIYNQETIRNNINLSQH